MKDLNKIFAAKKAKIEIQPGEYEGSITINHSCTVEGNGATLWSKSGAVLIINAPNITIKNLRVELTQSPATDTAIEVCADNVKFEGVEVFGEVKGAANISDSWNLPRTIDLKKFAAKVQNEFVKKLKVVEPCKVVNKIYGLEIQPENLPAGEVELQFKISALPENIILFGEFFLQTSTGILRRIFVTGRAEKNAPAVHDKLSPQKISPPKKISTAEPVVKGQRVGIPSAKNFTVALEDLNHGAMEIDAYAFMLSADGKVKGDRDLIFFGNKKSSDGGVWVDEKICGVSLDLKKIYADIQKIAICFAIYGDKPAENFLKVQSPKIIVYTDGKEFFELDLQVGMVKAITALEFYRHKGVWKIKFVGEGFAAGLKKLCEFYNLEVD